MAHIVRPDASEREEQIETEREPESEERPREARSLATYSLLTAAHGIHFMRDTVCWHALLISINYSINVQERVTEDSSGNPVVKLPVFSVADC